MKKDRKKKTYTATVIGCGYIGAGVDLFADAVQPATHAGAFAANRRTTLVALADMDESKLLEARKHFPGARTYTDAAEMLAAEKPDIVSIASSTPSHYSLVFLAAKQRVPIILCEKPLSDTLARGKEMVAACKKSGSKLIVNYQRHFDPIIQKWQKKVAGGVMGRVVQGNIYYYNGLANNAGHMVDLLNFYLGRPDAVSVRWNTETETPHKGPNADGLLFYPRGLTVTLQSLPPFYGYFTLTLVGEKGLLTITKNTSPEIQFRKKVHNKEAKLYFQLSDKIYREGDARSMLAPTVAAVVAVLDGKKPLLCTGEDALTVLRVLDALERSAEGGGKIIRVFGD